MTTAMNLLVIQISKIRLIKAEPNLFKQRFAPKMKLLIAQDLVQKWLVYCLEGTFYFLLAVSDLVVAIFSSVQRNKARY